MKRRALAEKNAQVALRAAIKRAIETIGIGTFKKTSFFISSYASKEHSK